MAPLKLISLSVGSLMLLQGTYVQADISQTKFSLTDDCKTEIDAARTAVGYKVFQEMTTHPFNDTYAKEACKAIKTASANGMTSIITKDDNSHDGEGTVAYVKQGTLNCQEAVNEFKKGFTTLGNSLPPAYTKDEKLYQDQSVINFLTLYNPKETAQGRCATLACTQEALEGTERRLASADTITAFVCASSPLILTQGNKPYTEDEWSKILNVFAPSSAATAVPTFFALVSAVVGFAFL